MIDENLLAPNPAGQPFNWPASERRGAGDLQDSAPAAMAAELSINDKIREHPRFQAAADDLFTANRNMQTLDVRAKQLRDALSLAVPKRDGEDCIQRLNAALIDAERQFHDAQNRRRLASRQHSRVEDEPLRASAKDDLHRAEFDLWAPLLGPTTVAGR